MLTASLALPIGLHGGMYISQKPWETQALRALCEVGMCPSIPLWGKSSVPILCCAVLCQC